MIETLMLGPSDEKISPWHKTGAITKSPLAFISYHMELSQINKLKQYYKAFKSKNIYHCLLSVQEILKLTNSYKNYWYNKLTCSNASTCTKMKENKRSKMGMCVFCDMLRQMVYWEEKLRIWFIKTVKYIEPNWSGWEDCLSLVKIFKSKTSQKFLFRKWFICR